MPCRDYQFDYEMCLHRGREHLQKMTQLLRQLCQFAQKQSLELPPSVAAWFSAPPAADDLDLKRDVFDETAQMLCRMCEAAEERSLVLPAPVAAWWAEHKARDGKPEDLTNGIDYPGDTEAFWREHAGRAQVHGINHQDAIRALEKAGFHVARHDKWIVMTDGSREVRVPPEDPVNSYAMGAIIAIAGINEKEFRKLLSIGTSVGGPVSGRP